MAPAPKKTREIIASCPTCFAFETLWFEGDKLQSTSRFHQDRDKRVYHNCNSSVPCRLIPLFWEKGEKERMRRRKLRLFLKK